MTCRKNDLFELVEAGSEEGAFLWIGEGGGVRREYWRNYPLGSALKYYLAHLPGLNPCPPTSSSFFFLKYSPPLSVELPYSLLSHTETILSDNNPTQWLLSKRWVAVIFALYTASYNGIVYYLHYTRHCALFALYKADSGRPATQNETLGGLPHPPQARPPAPPPLYKIQNIIQHFHVRPNIST